MRFQEAFHGMGRVRAAVVQTEMQVQVPSRRPVDLLMEGEEVQGTDRNALPNAPIKEPGI